MTFKIDTKNRAGSAYVAIVADYMERIEIALSDALNDVERLKREVEILKGELEKTDSMRTVRETISRSPIPIPDDKHANHDWGQRW